MKKNFDKRVLWVGTIAILFVCVFLINYVTPYLADDYRYIPHVAFGGTAKITSLKDVINSAVWFYRNMGGRVEGFLFATCFSYLPSYVFDFINTIAYFLVTGLVYFICKGTNKHSLFLYLGIHILLWFCVPDYGQVMFWMCGSANYLWTSIPVLGMVYIYRRYACFSGDTMKSPLWGVLTVILGVAAGWGMENISAGMLVILTLYLLYFRFALKIKIRIPIICGYAGSLMGFAFLVLAPGNQARMDISENLSLLFKFFVIDYYWVCFVGVLCILWLVLFRQYTHNMQEAGMKEMRLESGIYASGSLLSAYCMLAAPTSPERTWFIVCVYAVCAVGTLFSHEYISERIRSSQNVRKSLVIVVTGAFLIMLVSMADTMIYSYEITVQTQEREAYILEQRAQGNRDIAVPIITHKYPLRSHHDALTGLSDIQEDSSYWINTALADYYGVDTITGQ
ncbi:MAG: hypothetical protein J1F02_04145 [Lachnospiraceae bacterium]|nr:hypothetical protein [Lachnospiraceae bacterium]